GRSRSSGIGSLLFPPRLARRIGRCFVRPCASSAYSQSSERARGHRATTLSTMILDLTDDETATPRAATDGDNRRRPLSALAAHPHAEGNPRQDPPRAGAQAPPAAAAFRAAVERQISETRLG